jgi:hypothetical protein
MQSSAIFHYAKVEGKTGIRNTMFMVFRRLRIIDATKVQVFLIHFMLP